MDFDATNMFLLTKGEEFTGVIELIMNQIKDSALRKETSTWIDTVMYSKDDIDDIRFYLESKRFILSNSHSRDKFRVSWGRNFYLH